MANSELKIFIIYAREDDKHRAELNKLLAPLQRKGGTHIWCDRNINPGEDWHQLITDNLKTADMYLLLVSPDFLNSDYIHDVEMKEAFERHISGEALMLPIIVRPCLWKQTLLNDIQGLPKDMLPITNWSNIEAGYNDAAEGIADTIARWTELKAGKINRLEEEKREKENERKRNIEAEKEKQEAEKNRLAAEAKRQKSKAAFDQCRTIEDYKRFLTAGHPFYMTDAEIKIKQLQQLAIDIDKAFYKSCRTKSDYQAYLDKGYTLYAAQARAKINAPDPQPFVFLPWMKWASGAILVAALVYFLYPSGFRNPKGIENTVVDSDGDGIEDVLDICPFDFYNKCAEVTDTVTNTFTDSRDGKTYRTCVINGKTWMAENLNYEINGSYCYDDKSSNCAKYGRLYTWEAAKKSVPSGWHLPSKEEYDALIKYYGGENAAAAKRLIVLPFGALFGGFRFSDDGKYFGNVGWQSSFWSSNETNRTDACYMSITHEHVGTMPTYKSGGASVRCIKDSPLF